MTTENNELENPPQPIWRKIARWSPLLLLLIAMIGSLIIFNIGGIAAITIWYLAQLFLPLFGFACLAIVLIHWLRVRHFSAPMLLTVVVSIVAIIPLFWLLGLWTITYPVSIEKSEPATTVRLPANEELTVAWGGDSVKTNYHAVTPDQRWAYDFIVEPYLSESENLEDYGCYGINVLAPANGRIVIAHDGDPEQVPGQLQTSLNPFGNYVVIELPTETYIVIAHLKLNSVVVSEGDMVEEGDIVGQCGNTGNTSEPHIHIHHQRQNPADFPVNFAEGLPLYFRDHNGPSMPEGGFLEVDDAVTLTGDVVQHQGGR